jgi:hypothetical protein
LNTGTGKLLFSCLCICLLVQGVAAAQALIPDTTAESWGSQGITGAGVASPQAGTTGSSPEMLPPSRSEILDEFMDLALSAKNPASSHTVIKWARPTVGVKVSGDPDERYRDCLAGSIAAINNLSGSVILKAGEKEAPEIEVNFIPLEKFPLLVPGYTPGTAGYTLCESRKGFLQKCRIWVPTTGVDENFRCTILLHEMTHGMGLLGHSGHTASILSQGTGVDGYSPLDREVIRLLYNPALPAGITSDAIGGYLS